MKELEKYAVRRIIILNEKMDYLNAQIQIEFKKPETVIDFTQLQILNQEYTDCRVEVREISCCLLDQPNDDLPF